MKREENQSNKEDARKPVAPKIEGRFVPKTKLVSVKEVYDFVRGEEIVEFPLSIFPQHIQSYINKLHDTLKYEKSVVAASILFAVATSIGTQKKIRVKLKWETNPNLWIAVVGKKGTAKSHMMKAAIDPLLKKDRNNNKLFKEALRKWELLSKEEQAEQPKPTKKKSITNDVTVEGLLKTLEQNPNGLGLFKDELRGFFEDMTRYSANSRGFWLSVFNGGSWEKERVKDETPSVDDICISILGSIQPGVLNSIASNNTENGMIDRWLYVQSNNIRHPRALDDITEEEEQKYELFIESITKNLGKEKYLSWGENAKDEWLLHSNLLIDLMSADNFTVQLQEYLSKLDVYFPRFILIITLMHGSNIIEVDHVHKAIDLVIYFIESARNVFTGFENTTTIESIFRKARASNKQEKAIALLDHMPNMSKREIAEVIGCALITVYKAEEKMKNRVKRI